MPVLTLTTGTARAQTPTVPYDPSFSVERLTAAPGPGTFLVVEDADVAPHLATTFALVTSTAARPLVVRDVLTGETLSEPVELRVGADLLAAVGLRGGWQVGLALPLVLYQDGDRLTGLDLPDENEPLAATTFGDLRLHGKLRLVEPRWGYGLGAGADLVVTLPTGDDEQFAGEAGVVVEARLLGSYRARRFAVAANLGGRFRAEEVPFLAPGIVLGNEITYGVAGSAVIPGLPGGATALAELAGAWADEGGASPVEARLGARARVTPLWSLGAWGGGGVGDATIGSPAWRAVVEVRYEPRPRADGDHDGIVDVDDRCPATPEDADGVADADGCVDPDDDGDGIPDVADRCRTEAEDPDRYLDDDGCPDPDNDGDEIADAADKCPHHKEDRDGFADDDGCPDGDNDSDGVVDGADACRDEAEDPDGHDDADGCPDLDDDADGVADAADRCPDEVEDQDGWRDDDGCQDADDDRDGVPDGIDRCPDQPETLASLTDTDDDGCPDGPPLAKPVADGTVKLAPEAAKALTWKRGQAQLGPQAAVVVDAVGRAAHRAAWDTVAEGPALLVTVFDDAGGWSELAERRSEQVVERLARQGIRAQVQPSPSGKGAVFTAPPAAIEAGRTVPIKQQTN